MRVLLDECLPRKIKRCFLGHDVKTVPEAGWAGLKNGQLLRQIEGNFDYFVTIDSNLVHQQAVQARGFGIIVVRAQTNRYDDVAPLLDAIDSYLIPANIGRLINIPPA